jgi:hypothetical protein
MIVVELMILILEILMQPFHNYTGVASGKICKQQNTV